MTERKIPLKNKKFDESQRTFETRLTFILELFENRYSKEEIMSSCIEHKLDRSYLKYLKELEKSIISATGKDPLKIIKYLDD